jgi:hypothetical protein
MICGDKNSSFALRGTMADINSFRENLRSLVSKFEQDKNHYLQKGYPEAQVRIDFLNPFFDALGWDIENKAHKPPHDRDVIVELSPETGDVASRGIHAIVLFFKAVGSQQ